MSNLKTTYSLFIGSGLLTTTQKLALDMKSQGPIYHVKLFISCLAL